MGGKSKIGVLMLLAQRLLKPLCKRYAGGSVDNAAAP
jgi:hypothetical protein